MRLWRPSPRWPLLLAACFALTACDPFSRPAAVKTAVPPTTSSPATTGTAPSSGSTGSTKAAPSWPGVVRQAMAWVSPRTQVPLLAPTRVAWPSGAGPNSAQASASPTRYSVSLFDCPQPLPLNDPHIGTGACGAMASIYGSFGGRSYLSRAAALQAVQANAAAPAGCPDTRLVVLQPTSPGGHPGITATLYYGPQPQGNCLAVWNEGEWTFLLEGDLNGGIGGDPMEPWTDLARRIVSYLDRHRLPKTHGVFDCDLAPDGLHTDVSWAPGQDVYSAGLYHGAVRSLGLVISMAPYPR